MPQTKAIISVVNVVATGTLNQRVDLDLITSRISDVKYNPVQFPGLIFKLKDPKTTTLIFSSGKMVCTGAKSEKHAVKAVKTVVQRLRRDGIEILSEPIVEVQNIVASIDLSGKILVKEAAQQLPRTMYEPEQFPGLILRVNDPKVVFLLFASGRLVCVGAKKEVEVYRAVNNLHTTLEEKGLIIY